MLPFCRVDDSRRTLALPSPVNVAAARVVICTCGAAGMLREGDYAKYTPKIQFTHVMIDEAGQVRKHREATAGC